MKNKSSIQYPALELGGARLCGDGLSPSSRIAYDFAVAAHVNEDGSPRLRQKANGVSLEYHFHPLLASRFLALAGIHSPLLEETLLCHDIREETPKAMPWHVDREGSDLAFSREYTRRMLESPVRAAKSFESGLPFRNREQRRAEAQTHGEAVAFGVDQLSFRHQHSSDDKEAVLRSRLAQMPDSAKNCKACDALASLFEDVHLKTRKDYDNRQRIIERSQLIAQAVAPAQPKLANLIHALCSANKKLMDCPDPARLTGDAREEAEARIQAIRQAYRWENLPAMMTGAEAAKSYERERPIALPDPAAVVFTSNHHNAPFLPSEHAAGRAE